MTIGVGFRCRDGIVLCSDRQITSAAGFKYEDGKIFKNITKDYSIIFSYAGYPESAEMIFRRINETLTEDLAHASGRYPLAKVRNLLEPIFRNDISTDMETLIGLHLTGVPPHLFRSRVATLVDGFTEFIGAGDSSAIRYLHDVVRASLPTVQEAEVIGSYVVSVANRFIDGCSGGPDVFSLWKGTISERTGGLFPNQEARFMECESQIGKALHELLLSGGTKRLYMDAGNTSA